MNLTVSLVECCQLVYNCLNGDFSSLLDVDKKINDLPGNIRDKMLYHDLKIFFEEYNNNTSKEERKIGRLLEKSNYGVESGKVVLKLIDDMEVDEKVRCLARLAGALAKKFISADDFLLFGRIIKLTSYPALKFLKTDLALRLYPKKDPVYIQELLDNNLMYQASDGYCFTPTAFYLDKFSLSYGAEKYKYNDEPDSVPPLEKFYGVSQSIVSIPAVNPFI